LGAVSKERDGLANALKNELERARNAQQAAAQLAETKLQLAVSEAVNVAVGVVARERDGAIERLRNMKARLSTKMVGETLEQHCEIEFNRIRAAAFQRAHFEKDNDARTGSKGATVFRDSDESGAEIVSIMFEMKNESNESATKKRNEDFLKERDKDRTEKACEYAVRPQFFLHLITLLRNAALKKPSNASTMRSRTWKKPRKRCTSQRTICDSPTTRPTT
jgi:hypothetical protein